MGLGRGLVVFLLCLSLAAAPPANPGKSWDDAIAKAESLQDNEESTQALTELRGALKTAERFGESDPRLANTLARMVILCRYDEACSTTESTALLNRALKLRPKLKSADPVKLADTLSRLADAASAADRDREALPLEHDALELREDKFGRTSKEAADSWTRIAWFSHYAGDKRQARLTFQTALDIRREAGVERSGEFANLLEGYGQLLAAQEAYGEAMQQYDRATAVREQIWKPSDHRFVDALKNIAGYCYSWKDTSYAERIYQRMMDIQQKSHGTNSKAFSEAQADYASFLSGKERYQEAIAAYQNAIEIRARLHLKDLTTAAWLSALASAQDGAGKRKDGIASLERCLEIRRSLLDAAEWPVLYAESDLAEAYARDNNPRASEQHFQAMMTAASTSSPDLVTSTADDLASIYEGRKDYGRAADKLEIAVATEQASNPTDHQRLILMMSRLSQIYQQQGRYQEANQLNMRLLRLTYQDIQTAAKESNKTAIVIGVLVALLLGGAVAGVVCLIAYALLQRRLDRKLNAMYAVVPAEADVPAPEAPAVEAPPQFQRAAFHGEGSTLFAIRIINLLLSLLTLGTYSFWGKARMRRYLWGQTEYGADRIVFHGTGREMFFGWLRGLPLVAFIVLFPNVLPLMWQHPLSFVAAQYCVLAFILLLLPVARAGAHRYRLSRMSWRGIRFSFRGKTLRFFGLCLLGYLLNVLTLGLYNPVFDTKIRRFLYTQTYFGDREFRFTGRGRQLVPLYFFALPLTVMSFGLFWAWWTAMKQRYFWAHTTFAGVRFRSDVTGFRLLGLWLGNAALFLFTVGLGMPWITVRTMRFWTRHIQWLGEPALATVHQDARAANAVGESFADFLGFDFGV